VIRVLIADDHAVLRDGLRYLLGAQADIEVVGDAGDGREAVRRAADLEPDVALVDVAMPGLNGVEATRQIAEVCAGTKVVMLSMHSTTEHVLSALEAGARGYVLKESAGAELVNAVRMVHSGHRYLSPSLSDLVIDHALRSRQSGAYASPLDLLSPREREVLQLVAEGRSSAEIAESLSLSPKTVDTYRSRLMRKLDISDVPGLVKFALQHRVITLD